MHPADHAKRRDAFGLLGDVLNDLAARDRIAEPAGIKPQMQRRSLGGFDERELGFRTFSDFLRAAEEAGFVARVEQPQGHTTFRARPPSRTTGSRERVAVVGERAGEQEGDRRLRADVWRGFVDWNSSQRRFYDRDTDRVRMITAEPRADEDEEEARIRAEAPGSRYVEIEPIGMEEQHKWMLDFTALHSTHLLALPLRNAVMHAPRPFQQFSRLIRTDPALFAAWNRSRLNRVGVAVTEWMSDNELTFDIWEGRAVAEPPVEVVPADSRAGGHSESRVREAVHNAIDRMPDGELLKLSIPLEYLAGSDLR